MSEQNRVPLVRRIDAAHQAHQPHYLKKSDQILVRMMCRKMVQQEIGAREVGQQISTFETVADDLLSLINGTLQREKKLIRDPVHAAVMMGNDRLRNFLTQYVEPTDEFPAFELSPPSDVEDTVDRMVNN